MLLEVALPGIVLIPGENIHPVGADPAALFKLRAPDAVDILRLIQPDLTVQSHQLLGAVDVKHQQSAGGDEQLQPLEGALHIPGPGQIVDAVETADGGIHCAVEIQFRHALAEKYRRLTLQIHGFLPGLRQHIGAAVHRDHLIAALGVDRRHGAGTAGQIQHSMHRNTALFKEFFDIICPALIVYIAGQPVVNTGQCLVSAHSSVASPAFSFSSWRAK